MFNNCKLPLSMVLLLGFVIPVFSFEPSGGVLSLDGEDDYAILPFAEHRNIFPRNTHAFTVEIWFYPKAEPKGKDKDLILTQQVSIGLMARERVYTRTESTLQLSACLSCRRQRSRTCRK